MKSRLTDPLLQVVLTSIVTIVVSVGCSASRLADSSAQVADNRSQPASPIVSSSVQEKGTCTLNMSQAPVPHGLKLAMTTDEVLALFPGSKEDPEVRAELAKPPMTFGISSLLLRPSKYENKEKFVEVSQISFTFLDGRALSVTISYNGPQWPHVDKFVEKFSENHNFPNVGQWEPYLGMEHQMKTLTCADFSIRIFAGGEGGNLNYVLLQDLEADKKLKDRRKKAREQASPTPGNR
jgi:hypothetical protein